MDLVPQLNSSLGGRYAIDREIGRGGMATVYLARDLRHDRRVALKLLSPELGAVVGVERFLAEIKVTANLQHPNLLPLFDSGEADGHLFYVMPFVEGESLRVRLAREKQLPVDEALRIATSIAGALDYAHRHGVIHRDLKPENILLHEGQPLVADFGIALAVSVAGGNRITQTGISLGTPQYMSPEQATGDRAIDGRTDIYSLGAMLYEMLVGDPPYIGSTSQAIIAKVLTEKPHPVRTSRPTVPTHVDTAIVRALEKLPADRFASAQDFADALAGKGVPATAAVTGAKPVAQPPRRIATVGIKDAIYGTLLLLFIGTSAFEAWRLRRIPEPSPVYREQIVLPKDHRINDGLAGGNIAVSPRGDRIAYLAETPASARQLFLRNADQLTPKSLYSGTPRAPTFSPDGKWVAFVEGQEIKKVSIDGGPSVTLSHLPDLVGGLSWGPTGVLVAATAKTGLYVVPEIGGAGRLIPTAEGQFAIRFPLILPNGNDVLYSATHFGTRHLFLRSLSGGAPIDLEITGNRPLGYLEGQLIYTAPGGALMAVPFNAKRRIVTGPPVPVEQDVLVDAQGGASAALSASGMLVFRSGLSESQPVLARDSSAIPILAEPRGFAYPRFSPDGKRVAFEVQTSQSIDIWVLDRARGPLTRLTSSGSDRLPEWTADGRRILFVHGQSELWWQAADASSPAELLYKPTEGDVVEAMISPGGKWILYRTGASAQHPSSVFAIGMDRKGQATPLLAGGSSFMTPRLSPDGHWLAYASNISGRYEVYVRPFPDSGGRVQVSVEGGNEPLWSRSGHTLFYRSTQGIVAAKVSTGASFGLGDRKLVLPGDFLASGSHPNYDIAPGDSAFLMLRRAGDDVQTVVVHNWVNHLRARTSAPR
jgi:serine/threonine-protein kinase